MRSLAGVALLFLFPGVGLSESGIAGPLEDGLAAYERFDYATALTALEPLAEQGNVDAQLRLGLMYHKGLGVTRDNVKAMKWLRLAADQDNAQAQFVLGSIYWTRDDYAETVQLYQRAAQHGYVYAQDWLGDIYAYGLGGVPADLVQAYFWHDVAASRGGENDAEKRALVAKKMTPEQIAEAQRLAREWKPK